MKTTFYVHRNLQRDVDDVDPLPRPGDEVVVALGDQGERNRVVKNVIHHISEGRVTIVLHPFDGEEGIRS